MNIEIDGYDISYTITGTGDETVVILQGWGTHYDIYNAMAETLSQKYTVVQFDFPGFGESDEPREAWNVDAYTDFFCTFMQALGITRAHLIGHSYGGRVVIKLATRQTIPFTIGKIALVDSAGVLPERTLKQKISIKKYKILKRIFNTRLVYFLFPEIIDDWRSRQGSDDYRKASPIMRQCLVMAVNEDLTDLLPHIQQDTLLVWGDLDTDTPIRDAKIMEEKIPSAGLVTLKGAGHFCFLEQPSIFSNVLENYFQVGDGQ